MRPSRAAYGVPVMRLAIEGLEQRGFGRALVGFHVYYVHPNVPGANRMVVETRVGRMIDAENEVWVQLGKQSPKAVGQLGPMFGQSKLPFVVPPQPQGNQEEMHELERRGQASATDRPYAETVPRAALYMVAARALVAYVS